MTIMIGVIHRRDARAGENVREHLLEVLELRCHFLKQRVVVRVLPSGRRDQSLAKFRSFAKRRGRVADAAVGDRPSPASNERSVRYGSAASRHSSRCSVCSR